MNTVLSIITAIAVTVTAFFAWRTGMRTVVVNFRQRDNGDEILGCYVEQVGGPPVKDLTIRMKVNSEGWQYYQWPSLKKGQSVCIGLVLPAGGPDWLDNSGTRDHPVALDSLCVKAEYGRWWRLASYAGQKTLLDMRDGDAWHRALAGFFWEPNSALDSAAEKACKEAAAWFKDGNTRRKRAELRADLARRAAATSEQDV